MVGILGHKLPENKVAVKGRHHVSKQKPGETAGRAQGRVSQQDRNHRGQWLWCFHRDGTSVYRRRKSFLSSC